jgi:hypothetical protein
VKAVIRNCAHGGTSILSIGYDAQGGPLWIEKSSATPEGIRDLVRERDGLDWYASFVSYLSRPELDRPTAQYARLRSQFFAGRSGTHRDGLLGNAPLISSAIAHYAAIWGEWAKTAVDIEKAPVHGDLSVDNVIVGDRGIVFLDWEHFHMNALPVGFDACYLLFESLWYEARHRLGHISDEAILFVRQSLGILRDRGCLSRIFYMAPLEMTLKIMNEKKTVWGNQFRKFPILGWPREIVARIDRSIDRR